MIKEILFYGLYTLFILIQIISSSFIIFNKDNIMNITMIECKETNELLNTIINISNGILISGICIYFSFLLYYYSSRFINNNEEKMSLINNTNKYNNVLKELKVDIYRKFNYILLILFVLSVLSFIILNCIEFIKQIQNINDTCLYLIDNNITGFYIIYKLMLTIAFFSSYALIIILPIILY